MTSPDPSDAAVTEPPEPIREALAESLHAETADTYHAMTLTDARAIAGRMLRGVRGKPFSALPSTPVRPDLTAAVAVLRADAVDTHREPMWRYGVRHTLSVIEAALRAEQAERPDLDVDRLRHACRNVERRNDRALVWGRDIDSVAAEYSRLSDQASERRTGQ